MPRTFFRTSLVHYCHSPENGDPRPKKCRCRKFISRAEARDLVETGAATWLMDYTTPEPTPTWNVALFGRTLKTPRAHTIEKAHIERGTEHSDNGEIMQAMGRIVEGYEEDIALFDAYYDLEIRNRLRLFRGCGPELLAVKDESEELGVLTGLGGQRRVHELVRKTDELKNEQYYHEAPIEKGRCVLLRIGMDERSNKKDQAARSKHLSEKT